MKTNNIVIVGGGSSGWMTAATLLTQFPNKKITLIESPNIATVGVGENTLASINSWCELVGIKDTDFLTYVDGTFKLSIQFENFYRKDSGKFHYPFGVPYLEGNQAALNDWYFKKILHPETHVSDYAECHFPGMALISQNKLFRNEDERLPYFNFLQDTAYHFDATKFGLWLREEFCLPRGLNHVISEVVDVVTNEDGIEYLTLEAFGGDCPGCTVQSSEFKLYGDLFIDCTGFKSLLMGEALEEPFIPYGDILPNNSAWATRIPYKDKNKEIVTYTNCSAIGNGWVWSVPLWSRMGSGYVFSDDFISNDDALIEFQNHIGCGDELEYKLLKMRIGIHNRLWVKNVVAIGLSAGFIEPLESTGLQLTHHSLYHLTRILQRETSNQFDRDQFTAICKADFREAAEFVSMHFALSQRDDTPYWKEITNRSVASDIVEQQYASFVNGFTTAVFNVHRRFNFQPLGGTHCIAAGMNWWPTDKPALIHGSCNSNMDFKKEFGDCINRLDNRKESWRLAVKDCPTPYEFLKENFYK